MSAVLTTTTWTYNVTDLNDGISAASPKSLKVTVSVGNTGNDDNNANNGGSNSERQYFEFECRKHLSSASESD